MISELPVNLKRLNQLASLDLQDNKAWALAPGPCLWPLLLASASLVLALVRHMDNAV